MCKANFMQMNRLLLFLFHLISDSGKEPGFTPAYSISNNFKACLLQLLLDRLITILSTKPNFRCAAKEVALPPTLQICFQMELPLSHNTIG